MGLWDHGTNFGTSAQLLDRGLELDISSRYVVCRYMRAIVVVSVGEYHQINQSERS